MSSSLSKYKSCNETIIKSFNLFTNCFYFKFWNILSFNISLSFLKFSTFVFKSEISFNSDLFNILHSLLVFLNVLLKIKSHCIYMLVPLFLFNLLFIILCRLLYNTFFNFLIFSVYVSNFSFISTRVSYKISSTWCLKLLLLFKLLYPNSSNLFEICFLNISILSHEHCLIIILCSYFDICTILFCSFYSLS